MPRAPRSSRRLLQPTRPRAVGWWRSARASVFWRTRSLLPSRCRRSTSGCAAAACPRSRARKVHDLGPSWRASPDRPGMTAIHHRGRWRGDLAAWARYHAAFTTESGTPRMASAPTTPPPATQERQDRQDRQERTRLLSISFINFAHAIDHYVMLILATVVIELATVYGWSYAELIALGTPSFLAFGVFSLRGGGRGARWSRRNMMALFYFGCGVSLASAAFAPSPVVLGVALAALGMFAAIYHPVGTAMLIEQATSRGRSLAFNGVCGNLGVALAAGTTALLVYGLGWRSAFLVPALICVATGVAYLLLIPADPPPAAGRTAAPAVVVAPWVAAPILSR